MVLFVLFGFDLEKIVLLVFLMICECYLEDLGEVVSGLILIVECVGIF